MDWKYLESWFPVFHQFLSPELVPYPQDLSGLFDLLVFQRAGAQDLVKVVFIEAFDNFSHLMALAGQGDLGGPFIMPGRNLADIAQLDQFFQVIGNV